MATSDDDEFSYDSYFEEIIELSEDEDESIDDEEERKYQSSQHKKLQQQHTDGERQVATVVNQSTAAIDNDDDDEEEDYSVEEEYIEEIVEDLNEVPLAGEEDKFEEETSYDDDSTTYDPDRPLVSEEELKRRSTSTDIEIGRYSDHSMDADNAFELNLPNVPKSRQMSALTLDWEAYQDSTSSWGGWGSDDGSSERIDDCLVGGEEYSAGTSMSAISSMTKSIQETQREAPANELRKGVGRHNSSGSGLASRGTLSRNHSGGLRGGLSRNNSGGLIRPVSSFTSPGISRRKSQSHLITPPLDTLTEDKEEHASQHSPAGKTEQVIKLSRETLAMAGPNRFLPPPPPPEPDSDGESTAEFHGETPAVQVGLNSSSTLPTQGKECKNEVNETQGNDTTDTSYSQTNQDLATHESRNDSQGTPTIKRTKEKQSETSVTTCLTTPSPHHMGRNCDIQHERNFDSQSPHSECDTSKQDEICNGVEGTITSAHSGGITLPRKHHMESSSTISSDPRRKDEKRSLNSGLVFQNDNESTETNERDTAHVLDTFCPGKTNNRRELEDFNNRSEGNRLVGQTNYNDGTLSINNKVNSTLQKPPIQPSTGIVSKRMSTIPLPPSTSNGNKTPRSIDQLRRSKHKDFADGSHHSQASMQQRKSARKSSVDGGTNVGGDRTSFTSRGRKISRFEELLERSTAIKAIR